MIKFNSPAPWMAEHIANDAYDEYAARILAEAASNDYRPAPGGVRDRLARSLEDVGIWLSRRCFDLADAVRGKGFGDDIGTGTDGRP